MNEHNSDQATVANYGSVICIDSTSDHDLIRSFQNNTTIKNSGRKQKTIKMFNSVYYLAKTNCPFSDDE